MLWQDRDRDVDKGHLRAWQQGPNRQQAHAWGPSLQAHGYGSWHDSWELQQT